MKSVMVALLSMAALSAASFNGIFARGDKETVTVTTTVVPDCTPSAAETPGNTEASVYTPPVVIVPGTQSETATYPVPSGGATITPGVPAVSSEAPVPVPGTVQESSVATPVPVVPASTDVSSTVTPPVGTSVPVASNGTTSAVSTTSVTSTSKSTTVRSATTEATESTSATPSPTSAVAGGAASSFGGKSVALVVALIGAVALLV